MINRLCIGASVVSLGLAYLLGGYWLIVPVFLAMTLFWLILKKWSVFWSTSSLLVIYVLLAIFGTVAHLSVLLMAAGCTAALAGWDLTNFEQSIAHNQPLETKIPLETHHLRSLALATFAGLILVLIGLVINLQIPFVAILLLVLVAVGGLTYSLRSIVKQIF